MNGALAGLAVAGLALLAGTGVLAGFRRREVAPVRPLADPLDDRRLALERSLADLDDARAGGALDDAEFVRLRDETVGRLERVDRALAARTDRDASPAPPAPRGRGVVPSWAVGVLLAAVIGAVVLSSLSRDSTSPTAAAASDDASHPFAFFEERVAAHPNDVAARLDLGRRYLDAERYDDALDQYVAVLRLDPDDAEANAQIGLILFFAGRPHDALDSVDRALETAPGYPEAVFYRGVILLEGLHRPAEAIDELERYLELAPFGSYRDDATSLIGTARAALDDAA